MDGRETKDSMSDKHISIYEYHGYAVLKKIPKNRFRTMEEAECRLDDYKEKTKKYYRYNRQFVFVDLNAGRIIKIVEETNEVDK